MQAWLHSIDQLRAYALSEDPNIRRWAVDVWIRLYPEAHLVDLARRILDEDVEIRRDVARHLAATGDERWVPVLVRALQLAEGADRRIFVEALGVCDDPRAVTSLSNVLRRADDGRDLVTVIDALGNHRVEGSWRALAPLLELLSTDDVFSANLVLRILGLGRRSDVPSLVARWRGWERAADSPTASAMASWLGVDEAVVRIASRTSSDGIEAVLGQLRRLDPDVSVEDAVVDILAKAETRGARALLRALHGALIGVVTRREDRLGDWVHLSLGRPTQDYRGLVVGVDALIGTLASVDPVPEHESAELGLAVAAWWTVVSRQDLHAAVSAASDPWPLAVAVFASRRPQVPELALEVLKAEPERSLAWLAALVADEVEDLVMTRALELMATIGAGLPERLAPYLPTLAHVVVSREAGLVTDAASRALIAGGPAAAGVLAGHLTPDAPDVLLALMGKLPCETSWEALADQWRSGVRIDLRVAEALTDLGDPRAIELLAPAWRPGVVPLAAMLLALRALHPEEDPRVPSWSQDLAIVEGVAAVVSGSVEAES